MSLNSPSSSEDEYDVAATPLVALSRLLIPIQLTSNTVELPAVHLPPSHRRIDPSHSNLSRSGPSVTLSAPPSSAEIPIPSAGTDESRYCWVCFATDEDDELAEWVQPCNCTGTIRWVHQSCLQRWVDEKQKGNSMRRVTCPQCQAEYIIIYPAMSYSVLLLERFDTMIKCLSPFLVAGIMVGSLYWTAVSYGAVTVFQVVGHQEGLDLMEKADPLVLLIGLPAIPVGLVLGRMLRWEDMVLRLIHNRHEMARKFPLLSLVLPMPDENESGIDSIAPAPAMSDQMSVTRLFCGGLLLPTFSTIMGRVFFESIQNNVHRTLIGGLTFVILKGALKIYFKQKQFVRKKQRKILDYTDENKQRYLAAQAAAAGIHLAQQHRPGDILFRGNI